MTLLIQPPHPAETAKRLSAINAQPFDWRHHWRRLLGIAALVVLAYVGVVEVLARLLVHFSAGAADANTQLNAVTSTRGALLGLLTPLVVALGGVAAFLNYREVSGQNRRTNERATEERDETRRLRRASVYGNFIDTCERHASAALMLFSTLDGAANYTERLAKLIEERRAFSAAQDQLRLLGSDDVQDSAGKLFQHSSKIGKAASSSPKPTAAEWETVYATEYAPHYMEFMNAARKDLGPTR